MSAIRLCSLLFLPFIFAGCVSLSKYNDRLEQIRNLNGHVSTLEKTLQESETARKDIEAKLQSAREDLAKLQEEHEALKSQAFAASKGESPEAPALEAQKKQFAVEIASLSAELALSDARIKELTAALAAREEAVKRVPVLEAAVAEREDRIKELTGSLRNLETRIAELKIDVAELSRKRSGSEEKEKAFSVIRSSLQDEINNGEVIVLEYPEKLIVTMREHVLFPSGSARISRNGRMTLRRMAKILKKIRNNQIVVEGHTDNCRIGKKCAIRYPTNWDLSAARATNVLKYLQKKGRLNPRLLALAGYSSNLPVAANDSPATRKLNRRIEIAIVPLEAERLAQNQTATMQN